MKEYGDGKTAVIGDFTIAQKENGSIETYKDFKNVKEGLREVAAKEEFYFDPNWNIRQFGSNLINFIEQKKGNNSNSMRLNDVFDHYNKPIKTQMKELDEHPQSKISNLENNETQTINNNLIEDKPWDTLDIRKGENNKFGFIDPEDKSWIIKPKFEEAFRFSEGIAAVKFDGKWGYITTDGNWTLKMPVVFQKVLRK